MDTAKQSAQVNRRVLVTDADAAFSMQARQTEALANMMASDSTRIDTLFKDVGDMKGDVRAVHAKVTDVADGVDKLRDALALLVKHDVAMEHSAAAMKVVAGELKDHDSRLQKIENKVPGYDELRAWVIRAGLGVLGVVGLTVLLLVVKSQGGA